MYKYKVLELSNKKLMLIEEIEDGPCKVVTEFEPEGVQHKLALEYALEFARCLNIICQGGETVAADKIVSILRTAVI